MNRLHKIIFVVGVSFVCHSQAIKAQDTNSMDTIYAGHTLPNAKFLKSGEKRYVMLIYTHQTCSSIKYLETSVTVIGDVATVVQKLMNGSFTNTDSVIINRNTLAPIQSYSDISTSSDRFTYNGNRVTGSMTSREVGTKDKVIKVDTTFSKLMFNGLIYAENFQCMTYVKNKPMVVADYVPGHQSKGTKLEYIRDEKLLVLGKTITAKVIRAQINGRDIYYWLSTLDQDIVKIEGKFPGFEYRMLRCI